MKYKLKTVVRGQVNGDYREPYKNSYYDCKTYTTPSVWFFPLFFDINNLYKKDPH